MASGSSTTAVTIALGGNGLVTVIKLVAFLLSGSPALLSEAIHSAADTGNQVLLLLGLRRGNRPSDDDFQYGYGSERFVFGLISAAGVFFLGCGVTVYHGIQSLLHPQLATVSVVTFAVLGASFLIEGAVLLFAIKSARAQARGQSLWTAARTGGLDPATLAILLEDGAAVFGVALASAAIAASALTGNPVFDALASIVIGLLLGAIAIFLVIENRGLLLGRAVPDADQETFVRVVSSHASVRHVHDVKTRQITPEAYLFKAEVAFDPGFLTTRLDALLASRPPVGDEAQRKVLAADLSALAIVSIATEIDAIEQAVRQAIPQAKHIDLEVDRIVTVQGGRRLS